MMGDVRHGPGTSRAGEPFGEPASGPGDGGGSGDHEKRLSSVEGAVRAINAHMSHVALREDVLKLKLWVLGGVIGGMVIALTLGIAIARLFLSTTP